MEIDFANLTDEMKAALKENLEAIEEATGVVSFDPSQPLSRTAMEQLKINQKIAGTEQQLSIYDAAQMAAKAGGADKALRESSEAKKIAEAFAKFRQASKSGQLPEADVLAIVATELDVTTEALVAGLSGEEGEPESGRKAAAAGGKKTATAATAAIDKETLGKMIEELYGDRLLPKFGKEFVVEGMGSQADKLLQEQIAAAIEKNPALAKIKKDVGADPNKKFVLEKLASMVTSTVDRQSRGRIAQMQQAGTGDILEEIPGIVKDTVESLDISGILAKAAPQPIILGGSESGESAITILSDEKLDENLRTDDPNWATNEAKIIGRRLAESAAKAS